MPGEHQRPGSQGGKGVLGKSPGRGKQVAVDRPGQNYSGAPGRDLI